MPYSTLKRRLRNSSSLTLLLFALSAGAEANDPSFGTAEIEVDGETFSWPVWTCRDKRVSAHPELELDPEDDSYLHLMDFGDITSMRLSVDGRAYIGELPLGDSLATLTYEGSVPTVNSATGVSSDSAVAIRVSCEP